MKSGENVYTSTQNYDYKIIMPKYTSSDDNNFVVNQGNKF